MTVEIENKVMELTARIEILRQELIALRDSTHQSALILRAKIADLIERMDR